MRLFRPTGRRELELLFETGMRAWPPRLPDQPIFYPVLNRGYAAEISLGWNSKDDEAVGFVTTFEVDDAYLARFERQVVGSARHEELWVPAEELPALNAAISGSIEVIDAHYGSNYVGAVPDTGPFEGLSADLQIEALVSGAAQAQDVLRTHPEVVFCNWLRWEQTQAPVLEAVRSAWSRTFSTLPLPERWPMD